MKITVVAAVIEAVFNNGKVQTVGHRLDRRDFAQLSNAAAGDVIRKLFYDQRNLDGETASFLNDMVDIRRFDVLPGKLGRKVIDEKIFQLPRNLGVLGIYPLVGCKEDEQIDSAAAFTRVETGSRWLYTPERIDDLGLNLFTVTGGKPELMCPNDIERVGVEAIYDDADLDVPLYVAYAVMNLVLGDVLKVAGFPVDMTADGNPNVQVVQKAIQSNLAA